MFLPLKQLVLGFITSNSNSGSYLLNLKCEKN